MIEDIPIMEQTKEYIAYDCDVITYIRLQKWATVSDHTHTYQETVFLIEGTAEIIIWDKHHTINWPKKLVIPPNTYHKFTAHTNIIGLEIK